MLTHTMSHEEVIQELDKDLSQVIMYYFKKNFEKILKRKIGRRKLDGPVQYVESYISKHKIEWEIHAIAREDGQIRCAIYALHRCKHGITVYAITSSQRSEDTQWKIYTSHFFDQYWKRFLQHEFDEPLHRKEIIHEYILYNTTEFVFAANIEAVEGFLTKSSRERMLDNGNEQVMGVIDDGICFGELKKPIVFFYTFIPYDMIKPNQRSLVNHLKLGLTLCKKGFNPIDMTVAEGRKVNVKSILKDILLYSYKEREMGISVYGKEITEYEVISKLCNLLDAQDKRRRPLERQEQIRFCYKPYEEILKIGK